MRRTKKLTLSAILVALGAAVLALGGVIEVLDLTASAFASLIVAFACIEIGSPYTWLIWLATSAVSVIIFSGSFVWMQYFVAFGLYPIIKGYIERLPKVFWIILKLVYANFAIGLMVLGGRFIIGQSLFGSRVWWIVLLLVLLLNAAFIAYDVLITSCVRMYVVKFRPRFKNLLK